MSLDGLVYSSVILEYALGGAWEEQGPTLVVEGAAGEA